MDFSNSFLNLPLQHKLNLNTTFQLSKSFRSGDFVIRAKDRSWNQRNLMEFRIQWKIKSFRSIDCMLTKKSGPERLFTELQHFIVVVLNSCWVDFVKISSILFQVAETIDTVFFQNKRTNSPKNFSKITTFTDFSLFRTTKIEI